MERVCSCSGVIESGMIVRHVASSGSQGVRRCVVGICVVEWELVSGGGFRVGEKLEVDAWVVLGWRLGRSFIVLKESCNLCRRVCRGEVDGVR